MELVFAVDSEDYEIVELLRARFANTAYNGCTIWYSGLTIPLKDVASCRQRINEVHEATKHLVNGSTFVFGLEDDTIVPPHAFTKLFDYIQRNRLVGYVEGVQVGRHNIRMLGAWRVDDPLSPRKAWTVPYRPSGVEPIDGGGLYCYMTQTPLFKSVPRTMYDDFFGPDVSYGLRLRQRGYGCFVDYGVQCGHKTETGIMYPDLAAIAQPVYTKQPDGYWLYDKKLSR